MNDESMSSSMEPEDVVRRFVGAVNAGSLEGIEQALTPDHCLIDPSGMVLRGAHQVLDAWRTYLRLVPKYHVEIERIVSAGTEVIVLGRASGGYSGAPSGEIWSVPAAWRAKVARDRVKEWQVFADNQPLRELV